MSSLLKNVQGSLNQVGLNFAERSSENVSIKCFNIHLCFKMEPRISVRYKQSGHFRNDFSNIGSNIIYRGKKVNSQFTFI